MTRSHPHGFLVAVGGAEDKGADKAILRRIVGLPKGGVHRIEVIPTASMIPKTVARDYVKAFGELGVADVRVMDIRDRHEADRPELAARIREADVVFMTGGDQLRLTTLLSGTATGEAIESHYHNGGVVAGTSAGAAAMSSTMIYESEPGAGMKKGNVRMRAGLGLVKNCVVDTHFLDRGRVSRLLEVVISNPAHTGVGLGEDTGVIISEGHMLEAIGNGVIVLLDGRAMRHTNLHEIDGGRPIAVENITIHTIVAGYRYDLEAKRYHAPERPPNTEDEHLMALGASASGILGTHPIAARAQAHALPVPDGDQPNPLRPKGGQA